MSGFDWDEENRAHIARHGVSTTEAEEVNLGSPLEVDSYIVDDEFRIEEVGETRAGRILKIVFVVRGDLVRVLAAYDASQSLKQLYLRTR